MKHLGVAESLQADFPFGHQGGLSLQATRVALGENFFSGSAFLCLQGEMVGGAASSDFCRSPVLLWLSFLCSAMSVSARYRSRAAQ